MRTAEQNRAAQVAYDTAYFVLAPRVFADVAEVRVEFEENPDMAAHHHYLFAAKRRQVVPPADDLRAVRAHTGRFDNHDYIVIEYPKYPAVDLLSASSDEAAAYNVAHVLAPYFSANLIDRRSDEPGYFVLGQSPDALTTLRSVTPEMNANLGRGCEPKLEAFVELLRGRVKG